MLAMARIGRIALIALIGLDVDLPLDVRSYYKGQAGHNNQMSHQQSGSQQILVRFDDRVINLQAVKKAAYRYINSFAVDFSLNGNEILCSLTFTAPTTEDCAARFAEDFKKEALDQDLREQIKAETEPIRNLIFALAFSKAGVVSGGQVQKTRIL